MLVLDWNVEISRIAANGIHKNFHNKVCTQNGGDFLPLLSGHGPVVSVLALIFVFVNLGSVCAHCLYNGAVGYSHLFGSRMRLMTLVLGLIGGLAAVAGVWNLFPYWLSMLGMFVRFQRRIVRHRYFPVRSFRSIAFARAW